MPPPKKKCSGASKRKQKLPKGSSRPALFLTNEPVSEDKMSCTEGLENLWEREREVGELDGAHRPGTHKKLGSHAHVNRNCRSEAEWLGGRQHRVHILWKFSSRVTISM